MGEHYKESKCPECGKVFYPRRYFMEWGYLTPKGEPVCSYSCQRKSEIKTLSKEKKRCANKVINQTRVKVIQTGETFSSVRACATAFNVTNSTIYRCLNKGDVLFGRWSFERVIG